GCGAIAQAEAPHPALTVVAIKIESRGRRGCRPTIDVAPGDRAALRVVVVEQRQGEAALVAAGGGAVAGGAFHAVPAEVETFAKLGRAGGDVDLFVCVLSHVGDIEVAGLAIEAEAPGIAEPIGPDLLAHTALPHERIVAGDGDLPARVDVDAEQL